MLTFHFDTEHGEQAAFKGSAVSLQIQIWWPQNIHYVYFYFARQTAATHCTQIKKE